MGALTNICNYKYGGLQPHAVSKINDATSYISIDDQHIDYTEFNKAEKITEGNYELTITYGPEQFRKKTELYEDANANGIFEANELINTRYYLGNYEKEIAGGVTKEYHYISGPTGLIAVYIIEDGVGKLYYTITDYLGSILVLTDKHGNIVEETNYDAWGRVRNPNNWTYTNAQPLTKVFRGYTGHEMLPHFALINMNGRMYDPVLGRMLSPDNYVQDPSNPQSYNRYSYALNNPLVYVDPEGEFIWFVVGGAIIGSYLGASIQQETFDPSQWESDWWQGAIVGGIVGAGAGALAATAVGGAATTSLMTTATGEATLGWSMTSSALISGNIGITSNFIQGRGLEGAWKGGLIGLAAGGVGAWSTTAIEGSSLGANLFSEEINTIGQTIAGATYGFGDRFVRGYEMGYRGGKLWGTASLGMLEGGLSGYYGGTWGENISFAGQSLITNSIASVPGLGFSIAKYYGYGLAAYGGIAAGVVSGGGVASLFANQTLGTIAGGLTGTTVSVGAFSLYPASLKHIKKHTGFYPTVLTIDQILQTIFR